MSEIWKPVKDYEGLYEVSNMGRVRSLPRYNTKGKVLKEYVNAHNGYCYVSLSKHNDRKPKRIHCLVMNAFCPVNKKPGYDKNYTIDHIDGDKTNNRLENLEWCTQSVNQLRAEALGLVGRTTKKVINLDTKEIYDSVTEACESVGGRKPSVITRVCRGQRNHYRNVHFAYYEDYLNNTIPKNTKFTKRSSKSLWR